MGKMIITNKLIRKTSGYIMIINSVMGWGMEGRHDLSEKQ